MLKKIGIISLLLILFLPVFGFTQTKDEWLPIKFFIGEWRGTGEGEPGKGTYQRSYKFILNGKFIEIRNQSVYPKQPQNPKGEVHQDIGYISFDKMRKTFVLRQFHLEGFVNQYKLESVSDDGKKLVFVSESIENIPNGWRAKETYLLTGKDEITEIFELAAPNEDFKVYSKAVLRRKK